MPGWALLILSFHWLGNQLFSSRIENDLVPVQEGRLNETRLMVDILAVILVLQDALVASWKTSKPSRLRPMPLPASR